MNSVELTGPSAIVVFVLLVICLFTVFVYLPAKLLIAAIAKVKQRTQQHELMKQRSVVAEYDPPAGFSPAELGFLLTTKFTIADLYAMVVLLQQQGLVNIEGADGKMVVVSCNTSAPELDPLSSFVMSCLRQIVDKPLDQGLLGSWKRRAYVLLNQQLRDKGYLKSIREQIRQDALRYAAMIGVLVLIFPVYILRVHTWTGVVGTVIFLLFSWPLYLIASAYLYSTYSRIAGEYWLATPQLKAIWSDIEGYREYVRLTDAEELQFESDEAAGIAKDKALPYAIALGISTDWQRKLG